MAVLTVEIHIRDTLVDLSISARLACRWETENLLTVVMLTITLQQYS